MEWIPFRLTYKIIIRFNTGDQQYPQDGQMVYLGTSQFEMGSKEILMMQ